MTVVDVVHSNVSPKVEIIEHCHHSKKSNEKNMMYRTD